MYTCIKIKPTIPFHISNQNEKNSQKKEFIYILNKTWLKK
jgi:hypothetical protein